ncbi:NADH:quinone oxidoreductase [Aliiroseovarius lamellibrachiae]|uniref:NADH:quinone oxidoreductase n=1 Tax=Aliiroseovarius lamellibrachiae TaxID=1924933 RepID=UPI001FE43DD2|nr:NADH:quinone oxidoreductase [Aliiroseovarius lamellibrachiae]
MSNQETGLFSCRNTCWIIGALLGVAVYLVLGCGIVALIVAAIVGVGAAFLLQKLFCGEVAEASPSSRAPMARSSAASSTTSATGTSAPASATPASAAPSAPASAVDSAALNAAPVDAKATEEAAEPAAPKAAPKKAAAKATPAKAAPAAKDEPKTTAAKKPAAKKAKADTVKTEAAGPTGKPKKPRTMKAPRKAGADDLKQLKGVGPKLEQTLNELGFWHFDQVAKWGADEISWVDDNLKFKGRIERDGWVDQAKILAEGGETAFSNKVKKGKVY